MSMTGKVVVVTGSSMGIGEAVAARFLREGASVAFSAREQERAEAARRRCAAADAAIVSSGTAQSGSGISGNTPSMVVVKTRPGYAPDPGHPGTGTVIAKIC